MISRLKSTAGVTMVELMALAVIVGVVASMAVPRFQQAYERLQFRSANHNIVSTLRLARSMSIADKAVYGVYFDYTARTMTLFRDEVNPDAYEFDAEDPVVRVDTLAKEIQHVACDVAAGAITFSPNGSAGFDGGGNITAVFYGENKYYEAYHNILRSTGRVKSYDSYDKWAQRPNGGA